MCFLAFSPENISILSLCASLCHFTSLPSNPRWESFTPIHLQHFCCQKCVVGDNKWVTLKRIPSVQLDIQCSSRTCCTSVALPLTALALAQEGNTTKCHVHPGNELPNSSPALQSSESSLAVGCTFNKHIFIVNEWQLRDLQYSEQL